MKSDEMKKKRRRRLRGVKIDEVSWVDQAASRREFLFVKRDPAAVDLDKKAVNLSVEFSTKGTPDTTSLKVNGLAVGSPQNLALYFSPLGEDNISVACEYTVRAKNEANGGFKSTRTYRLAKNVEGPPDGGAPADQEDLERIRVVCPELDDIDRDLAKTLAPLTANVALYQDDLPTDVVEDIRQIIQLTAMTETAGATEGERAMLKNEDGEDEAPTMAAQIVALVESQRQTNEAIGKLAEAFAAQATPPEPAPAPAPVAPSPAAPSPVAPPQEEVDPEVDITDEQIAAEAMEEALAEAGAGEAS